MTTVGNHRNSWGGHHLHRPADQLDGLLLVDKPAGFTSHDVVAKIRSHFKIKKVGHGGTLDPQATGLLVILIGKGTKLSQRVMGSDKTYTGTMTLGIATDSHDAEGEIIAEKPADHITEDQVLEVLKRFKGDRLQTPPMYSAVKKNGVPLYKMARKGKTVERDARCIHIYSFKMTAFLSPLVDFSLECTKGTYVRVLCKEVGEELGCGAHLSALRRTKSGTFKVENAYNLDTLLSMNTRELQEALCKLDQLDLMDL